MGLAYSMAIVNGILCSVVNTLVGTQPGQEGMLLYNISSAWIVIMGAKGLQRIRAEKRMLEVAVAELPHDPELLGYVDEEGYVENSTRKMLEEMEEQEEVPPIEAT